MLEKEMQRGYVAILLSVLIHSALLWLPVSWKKQRQLPPPAVASVSVIQLPPKPTIAPLTPLPSPPRQRVPIPRKPPQRSGPPRQLRRGRSPLQVAQPQRSPLPRPIVSPTVKPRITRSPSPSPGPVTNPSPIAIPTPTAIPTPSPMPTPTPTPTKAAPSPAAIEQSFQTVVDSFKVGEGFGTSSLADILEFFGQETQPDLLLGSQAQPKPGITSYQLFSNKTMAQVRDEQMQAKLKALQFTIDQLTLTSDAPSTAGEVWQMQRQAFQRYLQIMPLNPGSGTLLVIWTQPPPFVVAPITPVKN
ncbi:hypothetical protein IQ266_04045 [filamentous cyanobacterium LEGE 11480]|uniref:Uncharacterized protein n=1 Tax=Romeriopsis navalis LEGE 11480 TaxID=2777977 RepID=A0A928VHY0_9CYAN|nr:hypothetical protein [Romeriopsis navalis]MBE9028933.1 hypothetical protein [Romeriopsis navalis LEGE 11480]